MLVELLVENFAVVEKLRLRLHPGLNVLTGETGSGKSLVVDALGLLFGGRASTESHPHWRPARLRGGDLRTARRRGFDAILSEAGIETGERRTPAGAGDPVVRKIEGFAREDAP